MPAPASPVMSTGPIATAEFNNPKGIAMDGRARSTSARPAATTPQDPNGMVTTIAGDGNAGFVDNDDPTMAEFYGVEGLDVSPDGTRIVVADGNNGDTMPFNHVRDRLISPQAGAQQNSEPFRVHEKPLGSGGVLAIGAAVADRDTGARTPGSTAHVSIGCAVLQQ